MTRIRRERLCGADLIGDRPLDLARRIGGAVQAAGGRVKLVKMNIDEHQAIPAQMGIKSIPAVIAFVDGRPADGFMGAIPESEVKAFIDKLLISEHHRIAGNTEKCCEITA